MGKDRRDVEKKGRKKGERLESKSMGKPLIIKFLLEMQLRKRD